MLSENVNRCNDLILHVTEILLDVNWIVFGLNWGHYAVLRGFLLSVRWIANGFYIDHKFTLTKRSFLTGLLIGLQKDLFCVEIDFAHV